VYYYYTYPARFSFQISIGSGYVGGSYGSGSVYYDDYYYDDYSYDDGYYYNDGYYDDDYYYDPTGYDIYDGGASIVLAAVDRPLGVWVPGHWEEQYVLTTDWVWVPGHYVY
jgi:hypothetical protein